MEELVTLIEVQAAEDIMKTPLTIAITNEPHLAQGNKILLEAKKDCQLFLVFFYKVLYEVSLVPLFVSLFFFDPLFPLTKIFLVVVKIIIIIIIFILIAAVLLPLTVLAVTFIRTGIALRILVLDTVELVDAVLALVLIGLVLAVVMVGEEVDHVVGQLLQHLDVVLRLPVEFARGA